MRCRVGVRGNKNVKMERKVLKRFRHVEGRSGEQFTKQLYESDFEGRRDYGEPYM